MLTPLLLALFVQTPAPATETARIDEAVQAFLQQPGAVGISVAVARGSELVYTKTQGFADLEFADVADEETMFRIGSITKQFTAAAILRLAERGKLSVDDPLTKFLPTYPTQGHELTLRHLLTHTSGVPNYTDFGEEWMKLVARELTDDEMVALWEKRPFDFAPGERWSYSNSGYYLLGMVIQRASGQGYADFLRTEFFEPLKLTRTRYDSNAELILNRAQGYAYEEGQFRNDRLIGMAQPGAAGGLISTAGDLARWEMALVSGKVVKPESYEEMTLPFMLTDGKETTYGFGLSLDDYAGHRSVHHGGGIFGFNSYLAHFPESKLTIATISNSEAVSAGALCEKLARLLLERKSGG